MRAFLRAQITWLFVLIVVCFASTASFSATFPGSGLGQIPDSPAGGSLCGDYSGAPLNITFTVTGVTAPLTDVRVSFTSSGLSHSWVGDLDVTLRAPADAAVKTIFKQTTAATATACGEDSDVNGPYNFFDSAPPIPTWWQAAVTAGAAAPVAAGDYQATTPGGMAGGGAVTPITPAFAGLSTGQINGTWTLRFHDGGQGDTGAISSAFLILTAPVPTGQHIVDMNGDGKTDWAIVRSSGGSKIWFTRYTGVTSFPTTQNRGFGDATDIAVPGNYDADNKTDEAVWKPGPPGVAAWSILQSTSLTVRSEFFGQTGDDPTVLGDYNGDGMDDIAVYRMGAAPGDPSVWYWRTQFNGPVFGVQWGVNGDIPGPGDYEGDGKNDFVIKRGLGGQAYFWRLFSSGPIDVIPYGLPTDRIVPGDYDGDNKTDIAVIRNESNVMRWYVLASSGNPYLPVGWGIWSSDFSVQGDYDGDGKTDPAIWRPDPDPNNNYFHVLNSSGVPATQMFEWGIISDYPEANYNTH